VGSIPTASIFGRSRVDDMVFLVRKVYVRAGEAGINTPLNLEKAGGDGR
jgi:hypothetical protein